MKKYTANYAFTNPNFVVQNLVENPVDIPERPLLYVLKNILQRGFPTLMSQFLQSKVGAIQTEKDFKKTILLVGTESPKWIATIKGDQVRQYVPARDFLEKLIPEFFGEYAFIQSLLLPEVEINEITGENDTAFVNQRVDFYLPQAKMVIEIDGQQHKTNDINRVNDATRDTYLASKKVTTFRISTEELNNGRFIVKIREILNHLGKFDNHLSLYKEAWQKFLKGSVEAHEIKTKLLPTAIIRFQILLIDLLLNDYLTLKGPWKFNLILNEKEPIRNFAELAIEDFCIWFSNLFQLKEKRVWEIPTWLVNYAFSRSDFKNDPDVINIDFSLLDRWTDENILHPDLLFVRTDYFGAEKNYFTVSCADAINYKITEDDQPTLEFFLQNIFEKKQFREGQLPIISNVLNLEDTIGLLPTGGGKSLCYQLPCLLQPSVNFVVCPIKSLMYDQHQNMKNAYITNTQFITSDRSATEKKKVQKEFGEGKYLFVWISPERFQIKDFRDYIAIVNTHSPIAYAVIDEVHCLSEWGHDFRTSYLNLAKAIERYCPKARFVGLTATASVNVLKDIKVEFARNKRVMRDENIKSLLDYSRKELEFHVIRDENNKYRLLEKIVQDEEILDQQKKAALVFTPHVNGKFGCFSLANQLDRLAPGKVKWYSGEAPNDIDMNDEKFNQYKQEVQQEFKQDKFPLFVATKAFGMGIDKQNIYYTFHYGLPSSVEALYQEAGRAGRWNSSTPGMEDVKAKCYVLYSQETVDQSLVKRLFEQETTFSEIKEINNQVRWDGRDVFRQIFLYLQGQQDVSQEFNAVKQILKNYFKPYSKENIYFSTVTQELRDIGFEGSNKELVQIAQKAIYRLSMLGIVKDWTTNFINHYEVEFSSDDEQDVFNALRHFISKYQPELNLREELQRMRQPTVLEKCIWYLLQWTFDNVTYSRKQTLKTLADWCDEFEIIGNEAFKRRIDNYFRFTDTTFIYQFIAESPMIYGKWFEVFFRIDRDINQGETKVYIPTIQDQETRRAEFERLRDSLSRFLEAYKSSTGLNLLSGLIRIFLNDYDDTDGRPRFENAMAQIHASFPKSDQQAILQQMIELGAHMDENGRENLCASIVKTYPDELERLADHFGLYYLLDDAIANKANRLKSLNKKLYEQFEQIGKV